MRWKLRLDGSPHDLNELSRSLCDGSLTISPDGNGQYYLECNRFDACNTAEEVFEIAKEILSVLNGAAKLALRGNIDIKQSGVLEETPDGMQQRVYLSFNDEIHVICSMSMTRTDTDGNVVEVIKPADPIPGWMNSGLKDEAIGKVFRLFAKNQDWVSLYKIFEVIEEDVGGVDKIAGKEWAAKNQMRSFKHTANSPGATGDNSRHGKEGTEPPKSPMLLAEARVLIEQIIHHWLRSKKFEEG